MKHRCDFESTRPARSHLVAVRFTFKDRSAASVSVVGPFNHWQPEAGRLHRVNGACWISDTALMPGRYEYQWVVDGVWMSDPNSDESLPNRFGGRNSVLNLVSLVPDRTCVSPAIAAAPRRAPSSLSAVGLSL